MFTIIWQFVVKAGCEAEFERANGPSGDWARFYGRDEGYLGVELLRDLDQPGRYVTIDRWQTRERYEAFMKANQAEFDDIDRRCDRFTSEETRLGGFEPIGI